MKNNKEQKTKARLMYNLDGETEDVEMQSFVAIFQEKEKKNDWRKIIHINGDKKTVIRLYGMARKLCEELEEKFDFIKSAYAMLDILGYFECDREKEVFKSVNDSSSDDVDGSSKDSGGSIFEE